MALVSDHMDTPNPPASAAIPADKVWDMLARIDIAMLVTRYQGGLRGRPMSTIARPDRGLICILTEVGSSAAQDIRAEAPVLLSYQGKGDHVTVEGTASVNPDKGLVKDLWNPGAEALWPDGPDAHDVVALVIEPAHADVWQGPGLLRGIGEVIRGAVQGRTPDMGTRAEVDL